MSTTREKGKEWKLRKAEASQSRVCGVPELQLPARAMAPKPWDRKASLKGRKPSSKLHFKKTLSLYSKKNLWKMLNAETFPNGMIAFKDRGGLYTLSQNKKSRKGRVMARWPQTSPQQRVVRKAANSFHNVLEALPTVPKSHQRSRCCESTQGSHPWRKLSD